MKLTLHELSIGHSLQRAISPQDLQRQHTWMQWHLEEMFALAKEALESRATALMVCTECGTKGQHDTSKCPFPARHIPLFSEFP